MYEIGSYIIKNTNGVCKVEGIVYPDNTARAQDKKYYLLVPVGEPNGKVYVPVDTASNTTRNVMSEDEVWNLINRINDIDEISVNDEKMRETIYKETIKARNPETLVSILKVIYQRKQDRLSQGKKSTATDDRYFKLAKDYLYSEIGFVLGKNKEEVGNLIQETIG